MPTKIPRLTALAALAAFAYLPACADAGPTGGSTEPSEISVSPPTATLTSVGEPVNVQGTIRAADGTVLEQSLLWSSSDPTVATVTPTGDLNESAEIIAIANGNALITATVAGVTGGVQIVVAQEVASLGYEQAPRDAVLGQTSGEVRVAALDARGSAVVSGSGPVTLDLVAGSSGSLSGGPRTAAMQAGVASFPDIRIAQLGTAYRLRASWDGRDAISNSFDIVEALDAVSLTNSLVGEKGILVDGFRGGITLNDFSVTSEQGVIEVGVVSPAPSGPNEIVIFAPARRPALSGASWTTGVDTIDATLDAPIELDVTIWIVQGPFASQSGRALQGIAKTRTIWSAEKAGLIIDSVEVIDATADPEAAGLVQVTLCSSKADLEAQIGKTAGTINLYYVETVDGGTDRGRACPIGGDHIVMAENSGDELLSHELGHLLSLTHTDAITQHFDRTNVMHSASSTRMYLTEGQTFRQHFDPSSVLNNVFGLRSAEARSCPRDAASGSCPAIEGRIWQDGSFPPSFAKILGPVHGLDRHGFQASNADQQTAELAHRWVEISCEMDQNEGLTQRLQAAGSAAVRALGEVVATDSDIRHRRVALDGLAVIGGPESLALLRASELDPDLAGPARAARERLERVQR